MVAHALGRVPRDVAAPVHFGEGREAKGQNRIVNFFASMAPEFIQEMTAPITRAQNTISPSPEAENADDQLLVEDRKVGIVGEVEHHHGAPTTLF